jgi:exosortase A
MRVSAVLPAETTSAWAGLRRAAPALALGLVLLGAAFHREAAAAVATWAASTAYNHGFLVLPIALWLVWDRRAALAGVQPRPAPLVLLAALPLGLAWFAAERLGIMEGRQLAAMGFVEVLLLAVLGWRFYWLLALPFLYLFFLVPFGGFLVPMLQDFTAAFINHGLDLIGIPHFSNGFTIEIPEGSFYIAEACAGLRFLIASIAFGVLYAGVMYESPWRRAAFIVASIVVPIIANGLRALGIVSLGHILGSAEAATADHIIYGWGFFALVTFLLILLGLPFREAPAVLAPRRDFSPPPHGGLLGTALLLGLLALTAPLVAYGFDRAAAAQIVGLPENLLDGCTPAPSPRPAALREANGVLGAYDCAAEGVRVWIAAFPPRTDPTLVLTALRQFTGEADAADAAVRPLPEAVPPWRLVLTRAESEGPFRGSVSALWVAGQGMGPGLRLRLLQGWRSLHGGAGVPLIAVVSPAPASSDGLAAIRAFPAAHRAFSARLARFSAGVGDELRGVSFGKIINNE